MSWRTNYELGIAVPSAVSSALSTASTTVSSLQLIVNTLTDALNLAKLYYTTVADPYKGIVGECVTLFEGLVNDYASTGSYNLVVSPWTVQDKLRYDVLSTKGMTLDFSKINLGQVSFDTAGYGIPELSPSKCLQAAIDAFDDEGDKGRPTFDSSAAVSAFGIFFYTQTLDEYVNFLTSLQDIFNIADFGFEIKKTSSQIASNIVIPSVKPDFYTLSLNQIEPIKEFNNYLKEQMEYWRGYILAGDMTGAIDGLLETMTDKLNYVSDLISNTEALLNRMASLSLYAPYVFSCAADSGGNDYIKEQLQNSDIMALTDNGYFSVFVLTVAGSGGIPQFNTIKTLLKFDF